jgi:hypothetical protein
MIAFIDDHRAVHGVEPICKVLPIAPSTYHDHAAKRADPRKLSARAQQDVLLKPQIARVFAENFAGFWTSRRTGRLGTASEPSNATMSGNGNGLRFNMLREAY